MTRHDTAQQTTDSRQLIITTQAYTRHDTTRRDGIHDPCVRRVAGETSARCHARSSQHGRSVRRIGEKWPTRHRRQGVVISGGQWALGTGHWWCLSHRQVCYCFVDGRWPAPREHRIRQIRANATHRASPPSPSALRPHLLVCYWST